MASKTLSLRTPVAKAREAFDTQRRNSKRRGIPFLFTFEEWSDWWAIDDRWERRGRTSGSLVMARKGDTGPYAPDNVYCTTPSGNVKDMLPEVRLAAGRKTSLSNMGRPAGEHLRAGEGHPRSRAIVTPEGRFGNIRIAADHHGINYVTARSRVADGRFGWRYETE